MIDEAFRKLEIKMLFAEQKLASEGYKGVPY